MSQAKQEKNLLEEAFASFAGWMLLAIQLVVLGLWLVSAWLTKLLIEYVLDPITNLAFSRNDGLLIICSTLVWGTIIPLLLLPPLLAHLSDAPPEQIWRAVMGAVLFGLAWGVSVGVKVLIDLWLEIQDRLEPVYEPAQMLGEPVRLGTTSSSLNGQLPQPPLPTKKELEAELEEVFDNGTGRVS